MIGGDPFMPELSTKDLEILKYLKSKIGMVRPPTARDLAIKFDDSESAVQSRLDRLIVEGLIEKDHFFEGAQTYSLTGPGLDYFEFAEKKRNEKIFQLVYPIIVTTVGLIIERWLSK